MKRAFFVQLGMGLVVFLTLVLLARSLPVVEYLTRAHRELAAMDAWSGVVYPLFFAVCNLLLLPAGVVAIGSGLFFGLWWGFFLNLIGSVTGAAVAFGISRKLGRRRLEARFGRYRKWAALDTAIARHGWKIIFLSQVHPLFPTSLLNYLYGMSRVRFRTCMLWVALGQAPGLFLYSYLGTLAQLGLRLWRGENHPHPHEYVLWLGGLLLALAATAALGRVAQRIIAEAEQSTEQQAAALPVPPEDLPELYAERT